MELPAVFTILSSIYGLFLLAVAWGFDRMARSASNRTNGDQTGGFRYMESHDAWQCPEDQWLWPSSFDPENRVMRYRGNPTVCNTCPVKQSCTVSAKGREVTRQLDPWPHSETGRFHRGVSLAVALMGFILPLMSLLVHSSTADLVLTGGVLVVLVGGTIPLARHLWSTPSNFPEELPSMDNIEAEVNAAVADKYGVKYRSTKEAIAGVRDDEVSRLAKKYGSERIRATGENHDEVIAAKYKHHYRSDSRSLRRSRSKPVENS